MHPLILRLRFKSLYWIWTEPWLDRGDRIHRLLFPVSHVQSFILCCPSIHLLVVVVCCTVVCSCLAYCFCLRQIKVTLCPEHKISALYSRLVGHCNKGSTLCLDQCLKVASTPLSALSHFEMSLIWPAVLQIWHQLPYEAIQHRPQDPPYYKTIVTFLRNVSNTSSCTIRSSAVRSSLIEFWSSCRVLSGQR